MMPTLVRSEPREPEPANDTGTYYRLDEWLEPVECNRDEWAAFQKSGGALVAETRFGDFGRVVTSFTGQDDGFEEEAHTFLTMMHQGDYSEAEAHHTWLEAEAGHRQHVDRLKALFEGVRRASDEQASLL